MFRSEKKSFWSFLWHSNFFPLFLNAVRDKKLTNPSNYKYNQKPRVLHLSIRMEVTIVLIIDDLKEDKRVRYYVYFYEKKLSQLWVK